MDSNLSNKENIDERRKQEEMTFQKKYSIGSIEQ